MIRSSYRSHYRRMLPIVLDALAFRSNNREHRPVLEALAVIGRHADSKLHGYPAEETVPLDGVVPAAWRDAVSSVTPRAGYRSTGSPMRSARSQALRERLRCKEIWVEGADRYRNPDEDLPADFEDPAGRALCRPWAAPGRRRLYRARAGRDDRGARHVRPRLGRQPLRSHPQARRRTDCAEAAEETGGTRGAGRTQDRNRPALADD